MQLANGYRHVGFVSLGSTMDEAARLLASSPDTHGIVVTAMEQTGGRGRQSRVWVSQPGNLYASLILKPPVAEALWPQLSFVIALGVISAIRAKLPGRRVELKWPNDVLVDGKKISGILLEKKPDATGQDALVIGFGINCASSPADALYPATCLAAEGWDAADPESLLPDVIAAFDQFYRAWQETGFAVIRDAWLAHAKGVGHNLIVRQANGQISGIFTDLDAQDGALVLALADGTLVRIAAGDVYF